MSLEAKIMESLKTAMKAKDEVALRTLRAIKAAIIIEKTAEGATGEIDEATEIKMLQKMAKQRKDSLQIFEQQQREDLASKEREELAIIEQFLPAQMNEAEIKQALELVIAEVGASSMADLGKVMGIASKALAGKADGKIIASLVKELLQK
ncbi:MAG: GatB/YqeY domain-containing protein [Bacteroidota bacterium]